MAACKREGCGRISSEPFSCFDVVFARLGVITRTKNKFVEIVAAAGRYLIVDFFEIVAVAGRYLIVSSCKK